MPGAFGYGDLMRAAPVITMVAGSVEDGMPLSNLYDPQPGMRTRFVASGTVEFVIDFGAAVTLGLVILGNTTLDATGIVRWYGSLTDPTGAAAEVFDESTATTDPDRTRGQAVLLLPADVSVRYLRIHIENPPGGGVDVGFLAAMPTLRLISGMALGASEGRVPLGVRDSNPFTGAQFNVPGLARPRTARFTLPSLRSSEFSGTMRNMLDDLTTGTDIAWVPETTLSDAELNRRVIYGCPVVPGQEWSISRDRPMLGSAAFGMVERV